MNEHNHLHELIALAKSQLSQADFGLLEESLFTKPLASQERYQFVQLLDLARALQVENPVYEPIYQHLLYLYVLNGSRLNLLKVVDRRLRGLKEGQGALLLIGGISGIGKTSLVMAFQERITRLGAKFLMGRCSQQEQTSYAVWQRVVRSASATGIAIETMPTPLGTGQEAHSSQHLKQTLADWLHTCALSQPLVILLDDLHWADVDSLEILNFLTSQSAPAPILYVATYRSEEAHLNHALYDYLPRFQRNRLFDFFQLEPLARDDIERLITVTLGACTPDLVTYLHERAEGHPLFTVGLLDDLIAQNILSQDEHGRWLPPAYSVSVPGYLNQLITQRVRRLGSGAEQVLSIASVAGESWSLKIVEPLVDMPEDDLLDAVERALRAEIITIEDEQAEIYTFSHGLIRQVLYTNQLARRRKRTHRQIAAQFEQQQPENTFAMAYHYMQGEQWVKAAEYCLIAGEKAIQQFAFHSALEWYQQALNAAERAGDVLGPATHLAVYERLGRTYRALEHRREAELIYSRMRDVAQGHDDLVAEGRALVNLANVRIVQYQFDLAEKTAFEALKIGERTNNVRLLAQIHVCLAGLYIYRGQLERSKHYLQEAQTFAETLDDSVMMSEVLKFWSYITIWAGQYHEAETFSQSLLEYAQKSVDPLVKLSGYQHLGWTQIETGSYREAYLNFLTVLEMDEISKGHHHVLPRLLNMMGYLYLELGGAQEALDWDQRALAASWLDPSQGNYEMRRYGLLNMATDYLHLGKLEQAQETVAQFEAIKEAAESVRFRYYNRYQLLMSEMLLAQQEFTQAMEWTQETRSLAKSNGIQKNIAKSYWFEGRALAGLGRLDEALDHLENGLSIADSIQHGSLRWKIRLSLAEVLRIAGKAPEGVIRQARVLVDETLLSLSDSPLLQVFLSSHWLKQLEALEQNPTPEAITYPAGLTGREVEVLQLVAQGATNQQVADILHISVRTVNTHMTNILNKTGLDNRTAASVFAIQHKLVTT